MRKALILIAVLAMAAGAQEKQEKQERKWVQKVFDVKYADVEALAQLAGSANRDVQVVPNKIMRAISAGGYSEDALRDVEALIKRYDVARGPVPTGNRNIELVAYMLIASPKGSAGEALPAEFDSVVKQLKGVFGYGDFRLLDAALIRTREGIMGSTSGNAGIIDPALPNASSTYRLQFRSASVVPTERANLIRLDGFMFSLRVPQAAGGAPGQFSYQEMGFNTELDIREGQKVVVGKSKMDNTGSALILVLTAKAID